jgi:hypothetical protein
VTDDEGLIGDSPGCQVIIASEPPPPDIPPIRTVTFDADGLGNSWYLVQQLADFGFETRDHVLKAVNVTGKVSNASVKFYRYGPTEPVDVSELEDGTGFTAEVPLDDTTEVETSARLNVNIPNARASTIRVEGTWDGTGQRDRLDQTVLEAAQQGIRR